MKQRKSETEKSELVNNLDVPTYVPCSSPCFHLLPRPQGSKLVGFHLEFFPVFTENWYKMKGTELMYSAKGLERWKLLELLPLLRMLRVLEHRSIAGEWCCILKNHSHQQLISIISIISPVNKILLYCASSQSFRCKKILKGNSLPLGRLEMSI